MDHVAKWSAAMNDGEVFSGDDFTACDQELRRLHASGDFRAVVEIGLKEHEPELAAICRVLAGPLGLAEDALADTRLDLWRSLPRFRWQCPFRIWACTLARQACQRASRDFNHHQRRKRLSPVWLEALAVQHRTDTAPWLRTEVREGIERLRNELDPEEQLLLMLRVDRRHDWKAIATILAGDTSLAGDTYLAGEACGNEGADRPELVRAAAMQRKRFERLKDKLRKYAVKAGLLAAPS